MSAQWPGSGARLWVGLTLSAMPKRRSVRAGAIVTPEPGTALLLGGGVLALAFGARRRPA